MNINKTMIHSFVWCDDSRSYLTHALLLTRDAVISTHSKNNTCIREDAQTDAYSQFIITGSHVYWTCEQE